MSCSKWAYIPAKCDGDFCPGDCDYCGKATELLTPEEFAVVMREAAKIPDQERSHGAGDQLMMKTLVALGYGDGVKVFDDMPKWYA